MRKKARIIAFYLPQFHTIPENDKWWGKGFTEWTNIKKAKPLYPKHNQPRIPYKENYYDLSSVEVMQEQAKVAKEHGVTGFCYYHYWFKGHKLLNTPLENMLADLNVDIDFCLSWANEPWTRAWDGGDKEILMPQDYGIEQDWDKHISYLIPFFKDARYIKIDERPVFLVYRTESFSRFDKMINFWNQRLHAEGINDIYLIETLNSFQNKPFCSSSSAVLEFEPMFTIANELSLLERFTIKVKRTFLDGGLIKIKYSKVWENILKRENKNKYENKKLFSGCFTGWDNTPRKGKRGIVLENSSPLLFKKYFKQLIHSNDNDLVFINAWNEWAEGAYLEPDTINENGYLKSIKDVIEKND
nr:glycoside hydrolase family 99-like domain-containing protein [uncultured Pedobacter sp.]